MRLCIPCVLILILCTCRGPCDNDSIRCPDEQTNLRFSQQSWEPGDYEVHFYFPGFAAQCVFTVPNPPTTMLENFTACEADATYVTEPASETKDVELVALFNSDGLTVGLTAIDIYEQLAEGFVRVIVIANGETVFDEESNEFTLRELDESCKVCVSSSVQLAYP
jgi:hypothetical protein